MPACWVESIAVTGAFRDFAKLTVVHELAHVWDAAASGYFSSSMCGETGSSLNGDGTYNPGLSPGASD